MVTLVNRAKMTTDTTGEGAISLASAVEGYQTFADAGVTDADVVRYVIEDGNAWEIGSGTYSSGNLTRVLDESSTGSLLNLSGEAVVYVTAAAADLQELVDFADNFVLPTADGSTGQVLTTNGAGTLSFTTISGYTDADVDTHLNTYAAESGGVLSWTGSDYDWIPAPSSLTGQTDSASPYETSLGFEAGLNNTGSGNTFTGYRAGKSNTTGANNTANGYQALRFNTTGGQNTVTGNYALYANSTGAGNVVNGYQAIRFNTTGNYNIANGNQVLYSNTTGSYNTANGNQALYSNTTGIHNVANGNQTLYSNTTGSGNIGIGFFNNIGAYAPVFDPTVEDNRIVMGHTAVTNAYVQVAWTVVSDARDKTAFAPVPHGLDFVNAMKPTEYQFKAGGRDGEADGIRRYGFLAQDVLALEGDSPVLVDAEDQDKLKLKESNIIPVLVKAIQELSAEVQTLKAKLESI
jgi:hypothetical protein